MSLLTVVFALFALIFFVSFLVETVVEATFGQVFDRVPILTPYKWTLMFVAFVVAIIGAFLFRFDLIYLTAKLLELTDLKNQLPEMNNITVTNYGILLTGFLIGRGSNKLHEVFTFILMKVQVLKTGKLPEKT